MLLSEAPNLFYVIVLPALIMALCGAVGLAVYVAVGRVSRQ